MRQQKMEGLTNPSRKQLDLNLEKKRTPQEIEESMRKKFFKNLDEEEEALYDAIKKKDEESDRRDAEIQNPHGHKQKY